MKSVAKATHQWVRKNHYSFWFKEETTSTNETARREAFDINYDFKIYFTSHQRQGRGRQRGSKCSSWEDTGNSFLSSWSYAISHSPQPIMAPLIGLALLKSCQFVWPNLKLSLKAPNDLFLMHKKVAGLLTESIQQGDKYRFIIGLGMNVNDHPKGIETATHIASELGTGTPISSETWHQLLDQLRSQFEIALGKGFTSQISNEDRVTLLTALNLNPLQKELFLEITDQGNLVTEAQTIPWPEI